MPEKSRNKTPTLIRHNYSLKISNLSLLLMSMCIISHSSALTLTERQKAETLEVTKAGKAIYQESCLQCHGKNLNDGSASPIAGDVFYAKWGGRSAADLLAYLKQSMPLASPGSLTDSKYRKVLAYMLAKDGFASANQVLVADVDRLSHMTLRTTEVDLAQAEVIEIPPDPRPTANPLAILAPVTDQMLVDAPAGDWLAWRRTYDAHGFSPLKLIHSENVRDLKVAWAWNMPPGRNTSTPLVHDGVMFVYGAGSQVYAFDAVSGNVLWRYQRQVDSSAIRYFGPRSISIYENTIITSTDDGYVVAIDVKSGELVWEQAVFSPKENFYISGGPLVAGSKVVIGTSTGTSDGSNFVMALDAHNGREAWRFYTVEKSGHRPIDSWNRVSSDLRQGAGIWTPASYDADSRLVFFGTGNTYRPQLLTDAPGNNASNDALYTNSTLALDIDTGELAWYFQHLPNDQWNYDWAFERTIATLTTGNGSQNVILSSGKLGIIDAIELGTGNYVFSIQTGQQNVVKAIDENTGAKIIDPLLLPRKGVEPIACPDSVGTRNWQPTSYNDSKKTLFTSFRESCMKIRSPLRPGDTPHGEFGQRAIPRPGSDGNFGGVKAIDVASGDTLWEVRQRTDPSTGILATAGGLVLYGSRDRSFSALKQATGETLWNLRLNGVPSGGPITFMAGGEQHIAVTTGDSVGFADYNFGLAGKNPQHDSSTIWVFKLR